MRPIVKVDEHFSETGSMSDCVRLRRNNLCRLDLKPCGESCPLRKTKEEVEQHKKNKIWTGKAKK